MSGNASVDVAVVGAGISGLYTAWRLLSAPNPPRVALFEASPRAGGRIDTVALPGPGFESAAEMGAMRFIPSMQMVASLLQYLAIPTEPFPCTRVQGTFVRNTFLQTDQSGNVTNLPYQLDSGEPPNAGLLLVKALTQAVPGALELTAAQWRAVTKSGMFKGRLLYEWANRNVAEEVLSNEAFDYVTDTAGLDAMLEFANSAAAVRGIATLIPDFAQGRIFRPVHGFGALVAELKKRLEAFPGFAYHPGHQLTSISPGSNGLALTFWLNEVNASATQNIEAGKVVLAMPKRSVELIQFDGLFKFNHGFSQFSRHLNMVENIAAFKLCLAYDDPWWQQPAGSANGGPAFGDGYALTDLPLRQVFFGVGAGGNQKDNARVLLATYSDTGSARYWHGLVDVSQVTEVKTAHAQYWRVSPGVLQAAVERQLIKVTGRSGRLPAPRFSAFMDWGADPFGGGWHEWKPGIDIINAIPAMRQPIPEFPIYLCGEAYSWLQSWIEGALMSAERMLQDQFHLPWPVEWLTPGYDIGP